MGSDTTTDLSSFANREAVKLEMLDILVEIYAEQGVTFPEKGKDYVLQRLDDLLEAYDIGRQVVATRFKLDTGKWTEPHVSMEEVDSIFDEFRLKLSTILLQLVSYDLQRYIAGLEGDNK